MSSNEAKPVDRVDNKLPSGGSIGRSPFRYTQEGEITLASSEDLLRSRGASTLGNLGSFGLKGYEEEEEDDISSRNISGIHTKKNNKKGPLRFIQHNSNAADPNSESDDNERNTQTMSVAPSVHLGHLRSRRTAASSALLNEYSTNAASAFALRDRKGGSSHDLLPIDEGISMDSFSILTSPASIPIGDASSHAVTPVTLDLSGADNKGRMGTERGYLTHPRYLHNHGTHRDPYRIAHQIPPSNREGNNKKAARLPPRSQPLTAKEIDERKKVLEALLLRKRDLEQQLAGFDAQGHQRVPSDDDIITFNAESTKDPFGESTVSSPYADSSAVINEDANKANTNASPSRSGAVVSFPSTVPIALQQSSFQNSFFQQSDFVHGGLPIVSPSALDMFRQGIFPMIRAGNVSRLDQFLRAGVFSVWERELIRRPSEDDVTLLSSLSSASPSSSAPDGPMPITPPNRPTLMSETRIQRVGDYVCTGCTPLHTAAKVGRKDMASVLLAHGADVTVLDCKGRTPAATARASQHPHLAKFLELAVVDDTIAGHHRVAGPPLVSMASVASPPVLAATVPSFVLEPLDGTKDKAKKDDGRTENESHLAKSAVTAPSIQADQPKSLSASAPAIVTSAAVPPLSGESQHSLSLGIDSKLALQDSSPIPDHAQDTLAHFPSLGDTLTETGKLNDDSTPNKPPTLNRFNSTMSLSAPTVNNLVGITSFDMGGGQASFATLDNERSIALASPTVAENKKSVEANTSTYSRVNNAISNRDDAFDSSNHPLLGATVPGQGTQSKHDAREERAHEAKPSLPLTIATSFPSTVPPILTTVPVTPSSELIASPESTSMDQIRHQRLIALTSVGATIPLPKTAKYCTVSDDRSLIICLVGLPGRGKSFMSKRLSNYLNWKGIPCKVFNAGDYRRQLLGAATTSQSAFYDPNNAEAKEARERMAELACLDLLKFIGSCTFAVGILDATNTTVARRERLLNFFRREDHYLGTTALLRKDAQAPRILFLESICRNEEIITENILRAKCGNDDFKTVADPQQVVKEFRDRIAEYTKVYQPLDPQEDHGGISYMQIVDVKQFIVLNNMRGPLSGRVAHFLENLHPISYSVFIALPGETVGDVRGIIGGTSVEDLLAERKKQRKQERLLAAARGHRKQRTRSRGDLKRSNEKGESDSGSQTDKKLGASPMADTSDVCSDDDFFQDSEGDDDSDDLPVDDEDIEDIRYHDENLQLTERGVLYAKKLQRFLLDRLAICGLNDPTTINPMVMNASIRGDPHATPSKKGANIGSSTGNPPVSAFGGSGRLRILHGTDPHVQKTLEIALSLPSSTTTTAPTSKAATPSLKLAAASSHVKAISVPSLAPSSASLKSNRKQNQLHSPIAQAYKSHSYHHNASRQGGHLPQSSLNYSRYMSSGLSADEASASITSMHPDPKFLHEPAEVATDNEIVLPAVKDSPQIALFEPSERSATSLLPASRRHRSRSFIGREFGEIINNSSFRSTSAGGKKKEKGDNKGFHFPQLSLSGDPQAQTLPPWTAAPNPPPSSSILGASRRNTTPPAALQFPTSQHTIPHVDNHRMPIEVTPLTSLDDLNYGAMTGMTLTEAVRTHPKHSKLLFGESVVEQIQQSKEVSEQVATAQEGSVSLKMNNGERSILEKSQTKKSKIAAAATPPLPPLAYTVSFPRGTSCRHVNIHLETAVMHVMRADGPIMVVAAKAPAQGMLAYTSAQLPEKSPSLDLPFGVVMEVGVNGLVTMHKLL